MCRFPYCRAAQNEAHSDRRCLLRPRVAAVEGPGADNAFRPSKRTAEARAPWPHHLDSPIARQDIRLDITDLFVFRGETGTVFVIDVCHSIAGAIPAPGYHPEGMYEFKVDLDGDAVEDVTYRNHLRRTGPGWEATLRTAPHLGRRAVDPNAAGLVVAQGTTGEGRHHGNRRARLGR
ncbi:MAG: DUF4331 family protein [Acetobacteraceae bacterium]